MLLYVLSAVIIVVIGWTFGLWVIKQGSKPESKNSHHSHSH